MKSQEHACRYSLTIPLVPGNPEDWAAYLDGCRRIGARRVFLFAPLDNICRSPVDVKKSVAGEEILRARPHQESCDTPSPELYRVWAAEYRDKRRLFEEAGIEAAFWIGETIGHGGRIAAGASPFQPITGPDGREAAGCSCPLDEGFIRYMEQVFTILAAEEPPLILLDDDFRLNFHLPAAPVGCFCERHVAAFNERTGRTLTRERIAASLEGEPNPIRDAWLDTAGGSLVGLAARIEAAVHAVSPRTRIGLALAMTHWSTEGISVPELLDALAGPTRPYARLFGSPYRAWGDPSHIARVTEFTERQRHWLAGGREVEVEAEEDTYPHSRYSCPSALVHGYELGLHALAFPGILSYPFPFSASAAYEPRYVERLESGGPLYRRLRDIFRPDDRARGVYAAAGPDALRHMTMPRNLSPADRAWPDEPAALYLLAQMGIPLRHDPHGPGPAVIAGPAAAALRDRELEYLMDQGALLDATAARILHERGFDVGLEAWEATGEPRFEWYADPAFSPRFEGERIWLLTGGTDTYMRLRPARDARVISWFTGNAADERMPAVYVYESGQGRRVAVWAFDLAAGWKGMQLVHTRARQEQLRAMLDWVGREPLIASAEGPDLHLICRQRGTTVKIALQNTHLDTLENPVIRLSPAAFPRGGASVLSSVTGEEMEIPLPQDGHLQLPVSLPCMEMAVVCYEVAAHP